MIKESRQYKATGEAIGVEYLYNNQLILVLYANDDNLDIVAEEDEDCGENINPDAPCRHPGQKERVQEEEDNVNPSTSTDTPGFIETKGRFECK